MSWRPNTGSLPEAAKGKRVKVRLRNDTVQVWPADKTVAGVSKGFPATRWSFARNEFAGRYDIVEWDFAT